MKKKFDTEIFKKALALSVPMMIQNGITNAVGLVDNVMVGSLGTEPVTAVSIICQLIFVFNLAIFGGISGPGIYAAQYFGQKNDEGFKNTFRMKIWICLVTLVAGILIFNFGNEFLINLYLRGESKNVDPVLTMSLAKEYLSVMVWGLPFFAITQVYASSLRESGKSVMPMVAGLVSVVVDIVFNYLLIYGKFGFPKMGVKGAAVATVMARVVEMLVIIIAVTIKKEKLLKGVYKTLLVPSQTALEILKKGLPIFLNEFLWAGGVAALTQTYSIRGLDIVSGLNISNAICNLFNVVIVASGSAIGILTGQTLGALQFKKAEKDAFALTVFNTIICTVVGILLISVSGVFPLLYDTTDEIRRFGGYFIAITAFFFPIQGILNSLYFTLRSGGKTLVTFAFDSCFSWVISVPLAAILCYFTSLDIFAIYIIVQSADIIKVVIGTILIKKGLWISNIVVKEQ